ncbi:RNA polymerase sigma factor [Spirillospora sp. CA-128828]|uniref:RNA polymerase sigma factor n=1 Tax=Spirillospora sp. CA-128828 TaxID=3240033 RepID=UPI003D8EAA33
MDDELLVVRCQLGESEAFAELVGLWHAPVLTFVRRMLDSERADDVAQEIWVAVLRGLPRLADPGRFTPWLFTIARRAVLDRLRQEYTNAERPGKAEEPPAGDLAEEVVERTELVAALADLSIADCAQICGIPAGTVKSRLHRARRQLREHEPRTSAEEMLDRLAPTLSRGRRLRGVAALLSGLAGAAFTTVLWASEPGPLPDRTSLSFALLILVCLAWTGHGIWSATTRRAPPFALDRVIGAWIGLAAALLTTTVTVTLAAVRGRGLLLALVVNTILITAAVLIAVRAHRRRTSLLRRKAELTDLDAR